MIEYKHISESIDYYKEFGFKYIETPWIVPKEIDDITRPIDKQAFQLKHNDMDLVASGEQSFLCLYKQNLLDKGRFQTVTPCFRDEKNDEIHCQYFIKNELIETNDITKNNLFNIIDIALNFFIKYLPNSQVIETEIGYDIVSNNIELGSYGIRECEFLKWIYATGCAEPRLSYTINKFK